MIIYALQKIYGIPKISKSKTETILQLATESEFFDVYSKVCIGQVHSSRTGKTKVFILKFTKVRISKEKRR